MPKISNIAGQTFNDLTAIEIVGKSDDGRFLWKCSCQCGREKVTTSQRLKNNSVQSCGFCKRSTMPVDQTGKEIKGFKVIEQSGKTKDNRLIWKCECVGCGDVRNLTSKQIQMEYVEPCLECAYGFMVGQTYGDLLVTNITEKNNKGYAGLCKCSCGKEKIINLTGILRGEQRSCGCKIYGNEDLSGRKFHRLTVISKFEKQGNHWHYLCKCDCGTECTTAGYRLRNGNCKSCGCLMLEINSRLGKLRSGENNGRWRGGIAIYQDMRKTKEYTDWKKIIKQKYNNTCVVCNTEENIQCHHINSVTGHPEQIFDPNNGVCLCKSCHDVFHMEFDYGNNTLAQFNQFLSSLGLQNI